MTKLGPVSVKDSFTGREGKWGLNTKIVLLSI